MLISSRQHKLSAIVMLLALSCGAAYARGGIVYGARYYLPPGSPGTSHSHIYRIDIDGRHRIQLTYGNSDDSAPTWANGGRSIEFTRLVDPSGDRIEMIVRADGLDLHRIRTADTDEESSDPDDEDFPSPDKRHTCVLDDSTLNGATQIIDTKSGKVVGVAAQYGAVMWLNNEEFAEVDWLSESGYPLTVYNLHGKQLHSILLTVLKQYDGWQVIRNGDERVWRDPTIPGTFFNSRHAQMTDVLFWIDPHRKLVRYVTASDTESTSPNQKYFCTCSFNGTINYQHRSDGTRRVVWTSSLVIVNTMTLKVKVLQGGLVDCTGSDWRGGKRYGYD
jgi:hypothetical protein